MNSKHPIIQHVSNERVNYVRSHKKSSRLISIVGNQPFYCSSGKNSGFPGTFFPFDGLAGDYVNTTYAEFWYKKPYYQDVPGLDFYNDMDKILRGYYPYDVIELIRLISARVPDGATDAKSSHEPFYGYDFLSRFGNLKAMVISMLIGGGVWINGGKAQALRDYLQQAYPDYIKQIAHQYADNIKHIKGFMALDEAQQQQELQTQKVVYDADSPEDSASDDEKRAYGQRVDLVSKTINQVLQESESNKTSPNPNKFNNNRDRTLRLSYELKEFPEREMRLHFFTAKRNQVLRQLLAYRTRLITIPGDDALVKNKKAECDKLLLAAGISQDVIKDGGDIAPLLSVTECKFWLVEVREQFKKSLPVLDKHREPLALLILKMIGHTLSLGLVSKARRGTFEFWKTDGEVLADNTIEALRYCPRP